MTEKTAQQIAKMKEQTIGCEIEMNSIWFFGRFCNCILRPAHRPERAAP